MDGRPDYEILAEIGEGSYGQVFKARETGQQQRLVAVKKMKLPAEQRASGDAGIPAFMVREVALLRRLEAFRHPNIIRMLDVSVCVRDQALDMTVVFEYIDQDLAAFLHSASQTGLSRDKIRDVTRQLLSGLDFLHSNMVVHRDLKPDNVLISSRGVVKITDLGLARIYTYNIALTPTVVTLWYRAPEVLLRSIYMSSVDIWSAGCIFAELYLLRPLFRGFTETQQLKKIFEVIGLPRKEEWPEESPVRYPAEWGGSSTGAVGQVLPHADAQAHELLRKFLEFSPAKRITASQALAHPFLSES
ncbi:cyclin-dependent kinase 4 [Denticeps clupeoides]|uniref:cyclin-dependent kinase 4 n=1 Tax=Denticeps clupeoides TaxID=299321 RepID=UPI0010A3271A|nr:cyclin-dependent kinase 4-like [Denticeps clupeoides]